MRTARSELLWQWARRAASRGRSPAAASASAAWSATKGVSRPVDELGPAASSTHSTGGGAVSPGKAEVPAAASQPEVVTTQRHSSDAESIRARTPVTVGGASWV